MNGILRLAANDLRRTLRDRASAIWLLLLPVALMWFFGQFTDRGDSGPPQVSLAVVDEDGGWLAQAFLDELRGEAVRLEVVDPPAVSSEQGRGAVRTLTIPAGFTSDVLAGTQRELRLVKDPGADEGFSLAAEVHVARAIVRTLGRLVEMRVAGDPMEGDDDPSETFASLDERERLVDLVVTTAGTGTPVPSGSAQSVPGILTMTVLMMTVIYGGVFLTNEKREGMLRRQMSAPISRRGVVAGKLLGRASIAGAQAVVLLAVGRFGFGVDYGSLAGLVVLCVAYVVAVAGLATLIGAALRTPEQASTVGWLVSMALAAMGGCWWPSEVMPEWLRRAAHVLPTSWAMDGFHALISFGRGLDGVLLPAAVLLAFAAVFALAGARILRATA